MIDPEAVVHRCSSGKYSQEYSQCSVSVAVSFLKINYITAVFAVNIAKLLVACLLLLLIKSPLKCELLALLYFINSFMMNVPIISI